MLYLLLGQNIECWSHQTW